VSLGLLDGDRLFYDSLSLIAAGGVESPPTEPLDQGAEMAYGIVHHFRGGTQAQYEASIAAVHPADGSLPDGQIFHAAGPSEGG
jgi:hypothetical protein